MKLNDPNIVGKSLSDTILHCLSDNKIDYANELRNVFKVSNKRFWYLRLKALANRRDWQGMKELANEKKSPIGYRPFAEICSQNSQKELAAYFISRIPDLEEQYRLLLEVQLWSKAASVAFRLKDPQRLIQLKHKGGGMNIQKEIDGYLARLG